MDKVNLAEEFARIDEVYKPKLGADSVPASCSSGRAGSSTVREPLRRRRSW